MSPKHSVDWGGPLPISMKHYPASWTDSHVHGLRPERWRTESMGECLSGVSNGLAPVFESLEKKGLMNFVR